MVWTAKKHCFSDVVDCSIAHVLLVCVVVESLIQLPQFEDSPYWTDGQANSVGLQLKVNRDGLMSANWTLLGGGSGSANQESGNVIISCSTTLIQCLYLPDNWIIEEPMVVSIPSEERWTHSTLFPTRLELAVRSTVSCEVYIEPSTLILLPNSAPLQEPLAPPPPNNEWLNNICEPELGQ